MNINLYKRLARLEDRTCDLLNTSRTAIHCLDIMKALLAKIQNLTFQIWNLAARFNIKSEMRSFKSNENIHKHEGGWYYVVSANKASSVTL